LGPARALRAPRGREAWARLSCRDRGAAVKRATARGGGELVYVRPLDDALQIIDEVVELLHLLDCRVAPVGEIAEPVHQSFVAWVPSYPVEGPRQLWFEARLDNRPEAERWVSLVPGL
jgi:hypothetical protein